MKKIIFIALQNMKKKKGDTIVFFFLITLATILLYTSLAVFLGLEGVIEGAYKRANTADYFLMTGADEEQIRSLILEQEEVVDYEASDSLYFMEIKYHMEGETEDKQVQMFLGQLDMERTIGKLVGIDTKNVPYDAIALPYYMKASEGYEIGDICYFTIGEEEYRFEIVGFVEDPLLGTPLNVSVYGAYISKACMDDMVKNNQAAKATQAVQHRAKLQDGVDSFAFDVYLSPILTKEVKELSEYLNLGLNWSGMSGGIAMMSQISMGILLVFSLLLMLVVLIIIRFSIRNYIEMNLKNVGILQAAGYTSLQLNGSVLMEMGMIALTAVIAGVVLGVLGSGIIGMFEGIMLGLSWNQGFHPVAALITVVVILGIVLGVAFLSGRIYKKISVLEALRGGIRTHNFRKNYFSFEKTKMPIPFTLAGKNLFQEKGKNISILCIVAILTFSACVGLGLYENFALNDDTLLKMVGAEAGNLFVSGENMDEIGAEMEAWEDIDTVLYYANATLELESGESKTAVSGDVWKDPSLVKNEMMVSGRLPKYENEIVLTGNIAKRLGVDTGDTIYVTGKQERLDYIVCGIDQKIKNMGLMAMMSYEGIERLNGNDETAMLYVYTKEGVTYDEIEHKLTETFEGISVTDGEKAAESIMNGVTVAMVAICAIFVVITIFVVAMVEILLVKSKIVRERKNMGLNKALGFTTSQLMLQTMVMNLPVISIGAVTGAVLSTVLMEPLVVACLSFSGIKKCPFGVSAHWMIITVVGVVLVALISSFLSSVKIRKIEPVKLLAEE